MGSLKNLMNQLASEGADRIIVNPETLRKIKEEGVPIEEVPQRTLEENIEILFEERKKAAIELVKKIPDAPSIAVPAIESLYNEIRECILFGLNGAAITLSGILIEFVLKYGIVVRETGGFKYDSGLWDEVEKITLGQIIKRGVETKLISGEYAEGLNKFKNCTRNPYSHYNIKKITERATWEKVIKLNIKTKEVVEKDILAKDDPVIQAQAKPIVDSTSVFDVFKFADQVVKKIFSKI